MIDFPKPIDPFEHVKVQKIKPFTEEEKEKQGPKPPVPVYKKLFIYLAFLKLISNSLKLFRKKKETKSINETPLNKELLTIKSSLETLREKNLSHDADFLNFFAYIWMKFLKDYDNYTLKSVEISKLLQQLVEDINQYPENTEFTLGYYISEFAGYKWVPFPYMQILKNLYLENKKNPESSHLKKWIDILNELLKKI